VNISFVSHDTPSIVPFRGHLLRTLVARGHRVEVLAPNANADDRAKIDRLGVACETYELRRTGLSPSEDFRTMWCLHRHFRTRTPDLAIFYAVKPSVYGPLAARAAGVSRRIVSTEGLGAAFTDIGRGGSAKRTALRLVVSLLYKLSLYHADRAIFLNANDRDDFVRWRLLPRQKTRVVGGIGVDLSEYPQATPPQTPLVFLFVGRLLREKGIVEFVNAARSVRRVHPTARFGVLGAIDENPAAICADTLREWVESGVIEYHGHADVKPWLRKSSVFVLPSYREGVPRSTQEAMAVGRAVVTTDVPGCRDTVVDGVNGFLCAPRDALGLARNLCRFIENPDLVLEMGKASRRIAEERFDVRRCTQRIIEAYGLEDT
jgi:glycosyltransferase involved in cell wall biosynthesis